LPVSAVTALITILVTGGVDAVLHVRVAVEGVALSSREGPLAFKEFVLIVSATVRANRVVPCRLNTEKSIVDHPFPGNVLTTEADERPEICRWCVYRHFRKIL
jgi:hypothetical protein